jgi:hypothetical protein
MKILELDGKRYELVEIPEEPKRKTGYERNPHGRYYSQSTSGYTAISFLDSGVAFDDCAYNIGNYYTDRQLADDNVRADTLMRNLRRFSAEGRKQKIDWNVRSQVKHCITYFERKILIDTVHSLRYPGAVYFDTDELARAALEKYRDELTWYFTEYQDSAEFREGVQADG